MTTYLLTISVGYLAASFITGLLLIPRDRILISAIAYLIANFAASLVFSVPVLVAVGISRIIDAGPEVLLLFLIAYSTGSAAVLSLLPAIVIIGLAEDFRVRSALFYALAGTLTAFVACGLFVVYLADLRQPRLRIGIDLAFTALHIAVSGLVAGITYWLIAGRSAGAGRYLAASPGPPS